MSIKKTLMSKKANKETEWTGPDILMVCSIPALPPSVNHTYGRSGKGTFKTAEAKNWQNCAIWEMMAGRKTKETFNGDAEFDITFTAKNRRRWDIDNRVKIVQDCLTMSGVLHDDSQIQELKVKRRYGQQEETYIQVRVLKEDGND